jgi:Ser/Thr protein kinase RdoA (MazF antagonist)
VKEDQKTVTDNASGGVRGLRARPSAALVQAVRHAYGLDAREADGIDLGGSSSLNFLVTDDHSRYVVRVYRPYVTAARLADMQRARQELTAHGVPVATARSTLDGQRWTTFDGRLVEVEQYVDSDAVMDSWERLLQGLPVLGRMHAILRGVPFRAEGRSPRFANHIEPQQALGRTLQGTRRIRGWQPSSPDDRRLAATSEELAHAVSAAERELAPLLPRQGVHGDYWHNNVRFREGGVVFVTDFDFMGERARIDDLALTRSSFACSDAPASDTRFGKLRRLVDAYEGGLREPLSVVERTALPLAIARQPWWSIGGWIAVRDEEAAARRHAASMLGEVEWALRLVRELDRWQAAFT